MGIDRLTEKAVVEFAQHACECPFAHKRGQRPSRRYVERTRRFATYLVRLGAAPTSEVPLPKAVPELLVEFRDWMTHHRGVKAPTVNRYHRLMEEMLPALGCDPAAYDASLVLQVLLHPIDGLSCGYDKTYVVAFRAFPRFLATQKRCRSHLERAVPTVPEWKLSALPRYLETDDVERVVASCDLSKSHGVRDRAILRLLARLGLRAGDIMTMRLDDLDWDADTERIRGKGRREVCLPLPRDAGEALIDYIVKVRPKADTDRIFLCMNAPLRPIGNSSTISGIVQSALRRAGIADPPSKGSHLLRHSAATAMLRCGASLDMVATVLRHESSDTTAYYAKVNIELLGRIAQPRIG